MYNDTLSFDGMETFVSEQGKRFDNISVEDHTWGK